MKKAFALFILFTWAPVALAAHPPLTAGTEVPGIATKHARMLFNHASTLLKATEKTFRNHVDMKTPLAADETQCAVVKFAAAYLRDTLLSAKSVLSPAEVAGIEKALAYYAALDEQFCGPPPGSTVNRGAQLVGLFVKRQTESASQARVVTEKYEARAESIRDNGGPNLTATEVAVAVAIGLAILAKEAVPVIP